MVNNFCYDINCLNINRVSISRTKCNDRVTLKDLPTSCFRYNSGKKHKIPKFENEAKQN